MVEVLQESMVERARLDRLARTSGCQITPQVLGGAPHATGPPPSIADVLAACGAALVEATPAIDFIALCATSKRTAAVTDPTVLKALEEQLPVLGSEFVKRRLAAAAHPLQRRRRRDRGAPSAPVRCRTGSRKPRTPPLRRLKRGRAGRHSSSPPAETAPHPCIAGALLRSQPHQNRFHYRLQAILLSSPCCTPRLSVERCCSRAPESAPRPGSGGAGAASGKPRSGPGSMQAPSPEVRARFCFARTCESGAHVAPAGHLRRFSF